MEGTCPSSPGLFRGPGKQRTEAYRLLLRTWKESFRKEGEMPVRLGLGGWPNLSSFPSLLPSPTVLPVFLPKPFLCAHLSNTRCDACCHLLALLWLCQASHSLVAPTVLGLRPSSVWHWTTPLLLTGSNYQFTGRNGPRAVYTS